MSFGGAIRSVLSKYATFSGRARRSEYWWWTLAYTLVALALYVLALVLLGGSAAMTDPAVANPDITDLGAAGVAGLAVMAVLGLLSLALFLPSIAVLVRRLHDTGRSGWWYLIGLVPFGGIVLLVFEVMDSEPGDNQYGPNPKGIGALPYPHGAPAGYGAPGGYGAAGYGAPGHDPRFGAPQG